MQGWVLEQPCVDGNQAKKDDILDSSWFCLSIQWPAPQVHLSVKVMGPKWPSLARSDASSDVGAGSPSRSQSSQRKYFATVETCFFETYVKTALERQVSEILRERVQMQEELSGNARPRSTNREIWGARLMLSTWPTAVQEIRTSLPQAKGVDHLAWTAEKTAACVIGIAQNRLSVPSTEGILEGDDSGPSLLLGSGSVDPLMKSYWAKARKLKMSDLVVSIKDFLLFPSG